jgi:hypothetical protein
MKNCNIPSNFILIFIIFLLGLLFVITNKPRSIFESFSQNQCPNILIQKGSDIYLHNSNLAKIPGINPIKFNNLEDYVEYTHWQRSQSINCPILFLQHSYDAQGKAVYKQRPSPTDLQGGLQPLDSRLPQKTKLLDANRNDPPYNENSYPGFDPNNQYIGLETPLDTIYDKNTGGKSANPMDSNWGGGDYTQSLIKKGFYNANRVFMKPGE